MGVLKDMFSFKYSFTKPFQDLSETFGRVRQTYDESKKDHDLDLIPKNYSDLRQESKEDYLARLSVFKQRALISIKFGSVLKWAGASWAFYNFVLTSNAIYSRLPSFSYFLSFLSGLIVFGIGAFWINSYKKEIDDAQSRLKKLASPLSFTEKEELLLLKNFIAIKRTALFFFGLSVFLSPYYLLNGELMNSIVSLAFSLAMTAQLFKYSLWIYQIQSQNLANVKTFFEKRGRMELFNPYL